MCVEPRAGCRGREPCRPFLTVTCAEPATRAKGRRPRKSELPRLLAAEIGPGLLQILTPQIRPPRRPGSPHKRPVSGRRARRREISGNSANSGNFGNPRNPRKIAGGYEESPRPRNRARLATNRDPPAPTPVTPRIAILATPGNSANSGNRGDSRNPRKIIGAVRFPAAEIRAAQAASPRNRARFATNRDPPVPTPPSPGILILATRFGARDPTPRNFWKFGAFWKLLGFQESPKDHLGRRGESRRPAPDPSKPG